LKRDISSTSLYFFDQLLYTTFILLHPSELLAVADRTPSDGLTSKSRTPLPKPDVEYESYEVVENAYRQHALGKGHGVVKVDTGGLKKYSKKSGRKVVFGCDDRWGKYDVSKVLKINPEVHESKRRKGQLVEANGGYTPPKKYACQYGSSSTRRYGRQGDFNRPAQHEADRGPEMLNLEA
jgi:hypothetical protein